MEMTYTELQVRVQMATCVLHHIFTLIFDNVDCAVAKAASTDKATCLGWLIFS
jgi:hypothetical protein